MSVPLSSEVRALLVLHLVPGLGPRLTAALLERCGSAEGVLQAGPAELREVPYIGAKLAADVHEAVRHADVDAELERMARHGVRLVAIGTPEYPASLATIPDPSHLLYARGTLEPEDAKAVAIVGSRKFTAYGRRTATQLAGALARAGYTVVSGLARGIDGVAHRAALEAGGRTIAVLAGGLSRIYPPEHADLAREVESSGALLSEAIMEQEPLPPLFPARNRIISGLCQGVVIVEAATRSGALITARHAAEQGRSVFAVPGPIDSDSSGGTNELIRKGAILVRSADDIREELEGISAAIESAAPTGPPPGLDELQTRIWELVRDQPRHADELAQRLGLNVPQLSGVLLMLEMKKVVRRLPGNRYERC